MGIIAGIIMFISFIPMLFIANPILWIMSMLLFGVGLGAQWWVNIPIMGDIIDDHAVRTGKYTPSIFVGYETFFIRFGEAFKAATIAIAHLATGFEEGIRNRADLIASNPEWELALIGIRIHAALVPAIVVAITTILFAFLYPLTPAKIAENKARLDEMDVETEEE